MSEYKKDYRYDSKPDPDYYEQKFKIYLAIAQSDFYTKSERKQAFESAYQQVEEMKRQGLDYFLRDTDFKEIKQNFVKLCEQCGREVNVTFDEKEEYRQKTKISEEDFIIELRKAKTKQKITGLYKKLSNYSNGIVLTSPESWRLLVEITYLVNKDIKLFIELLKKNSFPPHRLVHVQFKIFSFRTWSRTRKYKYKRRNNELFIRQNNRSWRICECNEKL
jgi:hypothetical protein